MEWPLVKALLWALVVFLQIQEHRGCFEEERVALLELKAFLKSNTPADYNLPLWSEDVKSDCCGWERVKCNSTTGRAIELSLGQDPNYYFDTYVERWLLNVSLFVPFTELRSLDLSCNQIGGCLPNEGSKSLSRLKNLEKLDFSYNKFNTSIIELLSSTKSIKHLNLARNMMNGSVSTQELSNLENLEILDLSYNFLNGFSIVQELSNLENLKILNLSSNSLNGFSIVQGLKSLSRLENLEKLDLSYNNFNTSIIESLSSAKSIKNLNLAGNLMNGSLCARGSKSLSRLENLEKFDLSYNNFNTSIIESLSLAKSIKNLNLARNLMNGSLCARDLSNLENLKILDLSSNSLNGFSIVQGSKSLSGLENLEKLDLSYNNFNTSIIESLSSAKSIKNLNLAGNSMNGSCCAQGLANFNKLEILNLESNGLTGNLSSCIGPLPSLKAILLDSNSFSGTLPRELCGLVKLEELDISSNLFEGILPSCLTNLTSLRLLDISWNQFSGNISLVAMDIPKSIVYMDFSLNHFEGIFSLSLFGNHSKLEVICFANEKNSFEIETESPMGWSPLFQLRVLLLRNCNLNKLTHNVPRFLVN